MASRIRPGSGLHGLLIIPPAAYTARARRPRSERCRLRRRKGTGNGPGGPRGLLPWGSHRSGCVEQETHLVTPPRPTSQVPIIGFSALLQLVEWCHVRRQRGQQGGSSCVDPEPPLSPPRPIGRARPLVPRQFWLTLTVESRERILGTLSRIVAQQLAAPPAIQEATNERN